MRTTGQEGWRRGSPRGLGTNEVADGVAQRCFFEGDDAPASFSDGGRVLQHVGVEGGDGG
jgi:hypothetical protein